MAGFCSNCGAGLGNSNLFCAQCGARQAVQEPQAPQQPPQQPPQQSFQQPYQQPPAYYPPQGQPLPPASGGSGMKILLIALLVCAFLGMLAIGGIYYAVHRVKRAVIAKADAYGVDLRSLDSSSNRRHPGGERPYRACQLLPKDVASKLIDQPIDHTEDQGETCLYYGPAGLSAKLAKEVSSSTFKKAQEPGAVVNGGDIATTATDLARSMGMGESTGNSTDAPLITLLVSHDGKAQMTAITATKAIFGQVPGVGSEISNLGDRAVRLGNLGLNVLQGETIIRIIPGPLPGANERCVAIARAILPRV